jgi:hypothetical protein
MWSNVYHAEAGGVCCGDPCRGFQKAWLCFSLLSRRLRSRGPVTFLLPFWVSA